MNTFNKLAAAIAATLAAVPALALNVTDTTNATLTLNVTGASAQRDNFRDRLINDLCAAGTFDHYQSDDGNSATTEDFRAYSCTVDAVSTSKPDITAAIAGQNIVIYYRAEGGSVYGVGPLISVNPTFAGGVKRLVVDTDCANPTTAGQGTVVHNCPITGYDLTSDTDTTFPSRLTNAPTELGVSDVEPARFVGANWPNVGTSVLGTAPTTAQLGAVNTSAKVATGTWFYLIASNNGVTANLHNISRQMAASIFAGQAATWDQVLQLSNTSPVATQGAVSASADAIKVCRRELGSGTQVAAALFFHDYTCNASAPNFVTDNGTSVFEIGSSGGMGTCVANGSTGNAIGFTNGSVPSGTHLVRVDSVEPTRQNAALGTYGYYYESTVQRRGGLSTAKAALATALENTSRKQAAQSSSITSSAIALPIPGLNTASLANALSTRPVALGFRNKNSCKVPFQSSL